MPRKLDGTYIQTGSITTTQLSSAVTTQISAGGGPRVTSLVYPGNDTAANTVGGQTVYIVGSGFDTNNAVYINGNAVPSKTFISASNVSFTTPALSAGIYPVYFINTDTGATAIFVPGIVASAEPTWVTSATLSESQDEASSWSYSLSATGDAPITYALASGSSLPTGVSLASNGVISGTISSPTGNTTTYTFSVVATDAQNQDSTRQFSVTTSSNEGVLFANNVLLIHADGTNNKNNHTFLDSSNNNFAITRNGNATQGSFSPFSQTGWSNYFDGTGDYLTTSSSTLMDVTSASQSFTVEAWIYPAGINASGPANFRFTSILSKGTVYLSFGYTSTGVLRWYTYNGSENYINSSAGVIQNNAWQHVAVVSNAGSITLYVNGTSVATGSLVVPNGGTGVSPKIGAGDTAESADLLKGYVSSLRVSNSAVYTSAFTPSTSALTATANTQLLTCQSNRFIDNSTNAFTLTRTGDVSVQAFSPFAPTTAYSTSSVGGSGYFDGSGDYLTVPAGSAFAYGTGDFTVEGWFYATAEPAAFGSTLFAQTISGTNYFICTLGSDASPSTRVVRFQFGTSGGGTGISTSATYNLNTWNHFAIVRNSGSITVYLNGVGGTSGSCTQNFSDTSYVPTIGRYTHSDTCLFTGYLSNFRVVKGTAVYTTNFTPPTAPVTAIANTSLLCNFTNAGIFDQTAKNVLETVGDAKVSTTQYKYGTASMYFDGTGDWLQVPWNQYYNIGSSDYTVECWIKTSSTAADIVSAFNSGSPFPGWLFGIGFNNSDGKLKFYNANSSASETYSSTGTVNDNNWNHIAVTKSGTTLRFFINGTLDSTHTLTIVGTGSNQPIIIGADNNASKVRLLNGYIDDLRITRGYARYTSNFTAPSSAFKDK